MFIYLFISCHASFTEYLRFLPILIVSDPYLIRNQHKESTDECSPLSSLNELCWPVILSGAKNRSSHQEIVRSTQNDRPAWLNEI